MLKVVMGSVDADDSSAAGEESAVCPEGAMARSRSPYPPTKEPGARRATTHKPKVPSVALPRTRNFRRWMSITVGLVSCTSGTASQVPISTVSTSCHRCERLWTASCTIAAALGLIRATASRASRHVERERFVRLVRLSIGRGSRRRDASLEERRGTLAVTPCQRPAGDRRCRVHAVPSST